MKVRIAQARADDVFGDVLRLNHEFRRDREGRVIPAGRVCWMKAGNRQVMVVARGINGSEGIAYLDDALRTGLGVKVGQEVEVTLKLASPVSELFWGWNASHPWTRGTSRLALVSVGLGLVGLILGLISLFT